METRYIKLDHDKAVSLKKGILSSQLDTINAIDHLNKYRTTRKKESISKRELKKEIISLRENADSLVLCFPKEEHKYEIKKEKLMQNPKTKEKNKSLSQEVADIKRKLASLE